MSGLSVSMLDGSRVVQCQVQFLIEYLSACFVEPIEHVFFGMRNLYVNNVFTKFSLIVCMIKHGKFYVFFDTNVSIQTRESSYQGRRKVKNLGGTSIIRP